MSYVATSEIVIPKDLSPADKARFIVRLYDVHCAIFDGVDRASFAKYVVDSKAEHTWIQIHKNERGQMVGYFAVHVFEKELGGEIVAVVRGEAGMLSEYRGANVNTKFMIDRVVRYLARNPGRRVFYLGSLVHPSSYSQFVRYADQVWPSPSAPTPEHVASFMIDMASEFGLDAVDEGNPFVCKVGWRTRDTDSDRAYWRGSQSAAARYFLEANPGYVDGHGLLTLAPLTIGGLLRAACRYIGSRVKRRARGSAIPLSSFA